MNQYALTLLFEYIISKNKLLTNKKAVLMVITVQSKNQTRRQSDISLFFVVLGMWMLFIHELLKSLAYINMTLAYAGFLILFIAFVVEIANGSVYYIKAKYRSMIVLIWFFLFFAFLYGLIKQHPLQMLSRDILPLSYFACFLFAARTQKWHVIDKMIYRQFLIGLCVFIYLWFNHNGPLNRLTISLNLLSWDRPRIGWAWILLYGWQYMFLSYSRDMAVFRKCITIIGVSSFIVFGLIMLKRQVIIEVVIILLIKIFYEIKENNYNKTKALRIVWSVLFIGIFSISIVTYLQRKEGIAYFETLLIRSTQAGSMIDTTLTDARFSLIPMTIYNNASLGEVFFGQGLGSSYERPDGSSNTVESGAIAMFLKGGILYLVMWFFFFITILKDTFINRQKDNIFFKCLSSFFIFGYIGAPFLIYFPASGYHMFWLGRSVSVK